MTNPGAILGVTAVLTFVALVTMAAAIVTVKEEESVTVTCPDGTEIDATWAEPSEGMLIVHTRDGRRLVLPSTCRAETAK